MKRNLTIILSIILSLHLLYSNTMLLLHHYELTNNATAGNLESIFRILFSLSYSSITAIILTIYPRTAIFIIIAIIDGFGVTLKYIQIKNDFVFTNLSAIYFGVYTMLIIIVAGLIQKSDNQPLIAEKSEIKTEQSEIEKLNMSEIMDKKMRLQKRKNATRDESKKSEIQNSISELESEIKRRYPQKENTIDFEKQVNN